MSERTVRVATYTKVASRHDRAELARRHRRLAAAAARWPGAVLVAQVDDVGPTPPFGRPGLARLLDAARASRFDALIVEHLGRFAPSEDQSRLAASAFEDAGVHVHVLGTQHRRLLAAGTAAAIVKLIGG